MKSDLSPTCTPRRTIAFITVVGLFVGLGLLLMKTSHGNSSWNQLFTQEKQTQEKLEESIADVKQLVDSKLDTLLKYIEECNANIDSDSKQLMESLKESSMKTLNDFQMKIDEMKTNPNPCVKDVQMDEVDDSGALEYLEDFNTRFGGNAPLTADPADVTTIKTWWEAAAMMASYMNPPLRYQCKNLIKFGNWPVCQDEPYVVKAPCLVFSFGINYGFKFDDAIGALGCNVSSFDPSMRNETHVRSPQVTFYNMGLGSVNTNGFSPNMDRYVRSPQTWQIRTLKGFTKDLGLENRVIDVLKFDIESYEWQVLDNIIETDMLKYVRHLLIEYHLFPSRPAKEDYVLYYKMMRHLRRLGFKEYLFETTESLDSAETFRYQSHVMYVNTKFVWD
ncbi:uncharacterized protein LOC131935509 [Physella acuta]|uniref:uncharacterized protein LOC131935509 n=1 Tax=Physella acuta TaxID=109671 RepID=UPI0027DD95F6|nr:uncharacterized protein LOC131935509 [Physella acuta]XP_059147905.1 uncharacterized protein LOC131935509 [Physella acuta]